MGCYSRKNCHLLVRRAGVTREICRLPMARNKSAIIVAGSRFNCYTPSIDFTINIFGHPVSLASLRYCYYYYFLSPFLSFFFFFHRFVRKMFYRPEKGSGRRKTLPLASYYPSFLHDCLLEERIYLIARLERKRGFNFSKLV